MKVYAHARIMSAFLTYIAQTNIIKIKKNLIILLLDHFNYSKKTHPLLFTYYTNHFNKDIVL